MSELKKNIDGLASYGVIYDDILSKKWRYCGGDTGRHHNYFIIACLWSLYPEKILDHRRRIFSSIR